MLKGIHAALVTPFDRDLKVDTEALRRSVEYQIGAGIAGLCPLGGTGEPLSLTLDEHRLVIDTVMEAGNGRVPVTVGCLRGSQTEVIEMGRHARSAGAQRMMVVPPYFYGARFHDIRRHCMEVAAAVDLPVVLFHSPGRSGIRLAADELLTIFHEVPAVSAMKEASGDAILAADVMAGAPEGFAFLQGLDELLLQTLALGASGAIVSLAELLPHSLTRLFELVRRGDLAMAREIQLGIMPLCRLIYGEPNPGPLKHALAVAGRPAGPCRPPIHDPLPATVAGLDEILPALLEAEAR